MRNHRLKTLADGLTVFMVNDHDSLIIYGSYSTTSAAAGISSVTCVRVIYTIFYRDANELYRYNDELYNPRLICQVVCSEAIHHLQIFNWILIPLPTFFLFFFLYSVARENIYSTLSGEMCQ